MKNLVFILIYLSNMVYAHAQLSSCDGNRYKNYAFTGWDSTINVSYGSNHTLNNVLQNLKMDVYEPLGDTEVKRPLLVFIHGGGFVSGSKEDLRILCILFALRGFVTATIDYRLIDIPVNDSLTATKGMVQAMGDAKAALRFFVEDAATVNKYKIDTTNIYIGGGSAGGVTAAHVAYLDPTDNIPGYLLNDIADNGSWTGNSSTNTGYNVRIKGVVNYSGALWRKEFISSGAPPLFSAHDIGDSLTPCYGSLSRAFPFPIYMAGSCAMRQEANSKGIYNEIFINNSDKHLGYLQALLIDTVIQHTANFLYKLVCPIPTSLNMPEFADLNNPLYPNPASETLYFKLPTNWGRNEQIQLCNSMGVPLKEIGNNQSNQIDVSGLPKGLYYLYPKNSPKHKLKFIKE